MIVCKVWTQADCGHCTKLLCVSERKRDRESEEEREGERKKERDGESEREKRRGKREGDTLVLDSKSHSVNH